MQSVSPDRNYQRRKIRKGSEAQYSNAARRRPEGQSDAAEDRARSGLALVADAGPQLSEKKGTKRDLTARKCTRQRRPSHRVSSERAPTGARELCGPRACVARVSTMLMAEVSSGGQHERGVPRASTPRRARRSPPCPRPPPADRRQRARHAPAPTSPTGCRNVSGKVGPTLWGRPKCWCHRRL